MNSRLRRLLGTVSVFALMTGCAVQPAQNGANANRSPYAARTGAGAPLGYGETAVNMPAAGQTQKFADAKPLDESIPDVSGFKQTGRASWYGKHFNGRRTASGERFDMHAMTAAHKTLPLAAYVRVTNTTNNKSVVVKINDRGPYVRGRVIDLSFAAAREIGLQSTGTARVKIEGLTQEEALAQRQEVLASANSQQQ